ncbi:MAG: RNA 2',3'-cyclic phosphodiesterase [Motiliproteus sp.]|nr:RNA 2',3'-cyclic phosphodiesterase [Motiliproteus sp.]MCW9053147.1 RNA 2',3'-cyclic phosphodiesterase [Motiliproteus sp.]
MKIRAFFALPLKPAVVRRLADHADTLCHFDKQGGVQWVDSDNYHLTLCFLGDVSLKQIDRLEKLTAKRLADSDSFQVHLDAAEYYQVHEELALLAALAQPDGPLIALRQMMVSVIEETEISTRQQDFKPHVTLGRMKGKTEFSQPNSWPSLDLLSLADSVVLYQSKAGSNGSIYTPLFEIPLGIDVES